MKTNGTIQELLTLEEIERAEASYARVYGKPPFSLSTWNPSPYYRVNYLLNRFVLPSEGDSIEYYLLLVYDIFLQISTFIMDGFKIFSKILTCPIICYLYG